jgi:hypothetical protein
MGKKYADARAVIGAITRGGGSVSESLGAILPFAGVDQGDGTAALIVSGGGGGGGGGNSIATSIATAQVALNTGTAVLISPSTPASTQFQITVKNSGSGTIYVGAAGVTAANGFPLFQGETEPFPVGPSAALYSIAGAAGGVASTATYS